MLTLPWPEVALWPNRRVHRMRQYQAQKQYRQACGWAAKAAGLGKLQAEAVHLTLTFQPPDKRRRDIDNMLAATKAGLDGIADVIGVDDHRWAISLRRGDPVKGGAVVVEIETGAAG